KRAKNVRWLSRARISSTFPGRRFKRFSIPHSHLISRLPAGEAVEVSPGLPFLVFSPLIQQSTERGRSSASSDRTKGPDDSEGPFAPDEYFSDALQGE